MSRRPLLAITIPTYNRSDLLDILLGSIARDFPAWPDDLELIVIDNASTDGTRAMVERRVADGTPIELLRNAQNIGMDGNLAACFDATSSKYLWQIGDDEVLHQGACRHVLDFCRNHDFGLLHIDNVGFSKGGQSEQLARRIPERIQVAMLDSKDLFRRANVYLTFISANVINRHAVQASAPDFNPKAEVNTYLPQLAWIYGALKASNRHYHIRTPLFGALGGNTSGYKLIEVFGTNLLGITERQLGAEIPQAREIMSNAVLARLIPGELMALFGSASNHSKFEKEDLGLALDRAFGRTLYLRFLVKPMLSPQKIKRQIYFFLIRLLNRINRGLGYALL